MRRPATQAKPAPTTAATPVRARPGLPVWLMAVLLVLGTTALYWPATRCNFVNVDDNVNLTANAQVQKGLTWDSIKGAFLNPQHTLLWQPLTVLSHMVVYQVYGLNPWGHHLANVLLHAVNAALVFALLQQMTGATWRSLLLAALFAVHPLRVEAVAWVTERREVLCVFFGLLALIAYARYAKGRQAECRLENPEVRGSWSVVSGPWSLAHLPSSIFYLFSLFFFALGLMTKPTLVTWPFVMLLLDYWPLRRFEPSTSNYQLSTIGRLVREKIPFFVLAALSSVVTIVVQKRGGALVEGESLPLSARLGNALISYCRYLGKMFWPTDLAVAYPHPGHWPVGKVVLAGGVILGISVLVWVRRRRSPFLLMGWLWYCGTLVPMSQVVQTAGQAMADRWTYIPSLGVLILTVWGMYELTRRWRYQVLAVSVAGGVAIVLYLTLARHQIGYWKDSEALGRHSLEVTENNYGVRTGFGNALAEKGQVDEAIRQFQEAIRLKPDYAFVHWSLGNALAEKGQTDEAIRQFRETLRLKPGFAAAHDRLGASLDKQGQTDEAIRQFQKAVRLEPDHAQAHNNLGAALARKGQIDEAISQLQEAVRLEPGYAEAQYNLGTALDKKGQSDEAIRQFQKAMRLKPDYADAHNNLGFALVRKGQIDEAISQFQEVMRLKPYEADVHNNLGAALGRKGQTDEAIRQFQEAVRLKPDYADAHHNLGVALAKEGQIDEAIRQFQEALRLKPDFAAARKNLDVALAFKAHSSPPLGAATNH